MPKEAFDDQSDLELIDRCRNGDEAALDLLMKKYNDLIRMLSTRWYLPGGSRDDMIQVGRLGLVDAIESYDKSKGTRFSSFAYTVINRRMGNEAEAAGRKKHEPLNNFVSIDSDSAEEYANDPLFTVCTSPEQNYIDLEATKEMKASIEESLSDFENKVFNELLAGKSYKDIATEYDKSEKTIDNAIQRIRRKAKEALKAK
ncbi:MAG: sigma-70 family RNA polymerase sigma factor [Lachnospiraceae bacterium]|nr:sigma-70 family RNA polymerase sigma factor [Lachnospiraceae bacterium]